MSYGSLVNSISGSSQRTPEVGMGVTFLHWSDRSPGTIVEVLSPTTIVVQGDDYKRIDNNGMSECQEYEYSRNPYARRSTYTLRKNGAWVLKGKGFKTGPRIAIGYRDCYYDFSF